MEIDTQTKNITFPQRKIKKSYRSVTGHFPSIKNDRLVAFESSLEKSLFLSLEFEETVLSYMEQPQIEIQNGDKTRTYSVDCHVKYTEISNKRDAIVEVKYASEIEKEKEKLERKFKSIEEAIAKMGMEFVFFTDETFSKNYFKNIDFLYRYRTQPINDAWDMQILDAVNESLTASELANSLARSKTEYFQIANAIWALVAKGKLKAELNQEMLNMNSLLWRDDGCH